MHQKKEGGAGAKRKEMVFSTEFESLGACR